MRTGQEVVFGLWCKLTCNDPLEFGVDEREAFLARPQVDELSRTPYAVLLNAGLTTVKRDSLPLERWLVAARAARRLSA
ncbi:MAG TPA: hypothetical protein VGB75_18350 [Jatrophihabitans sp.]|jgi:hypothetical protein|uniref:hypothetical protein n=1 Tax=Jatrophihabitans sp. TaxID=1932789 RepID=UPI002F11691D